MDASLWGGVCYPWGQCINNQQYPAKPPSFREQEHYRLANCVVGGGELHMVATAGEGSPPHNYYSCQLTTASATSGIGTFYFTYGVVEARMWVASGPDTWVGLWTVATNEHWPPEIDVAETYGSSTQPHVHTESVVVHYLAAGKVDACGGQVPGSQVITHGWHDFAVDWEPSKLTWYLDGTKVWQCTGAGVPRGSCQYLILDQALDLFVAHPPITEHSPSEAQPDYTTRVSFVRVYQHPGVGERGGTAALPTTAAP